MKLKVQVEDLTFFINVGQGLNDFAWLALVAAKLYSQKKNPNANYLPSYLQFYTKEADTFLRPHPRSKIYDVLKEEEGMFVKVDIRKGGSYSMTPEQERWYEQAYGRLKNLMVCEFSMVMQTAKVQRTDPQYFLMLEFKILPEIKYDFAPDSYKSQYELPMKVEDLGQFQKYTAEITLPFGTIQHEFRQLQKVEKGGEEITQKILIDTKNMQIQVRKQPNPVSQMEIQKKIKENYKSPQQQLQQLELLDSKMVQEKEPTQLCPYNFKKLWTMIEKNADGNLKLDNLEPTFYDRVNHFLDFNLNKLYEVFYQYTQMYDQDMEKKDEIAITFQDIMHFLKFYGLSQDSSSLFEFVQFYDQDEIRTQEVGDTLRLVVKFPEFIVIIIKLAQYRKTINLVDVESQDALIRQIVEKVLQINDQEDQFNEFQKHMKFNQVLTNYIRENQTRLQSVFISRLRISSDQQYKIKCHIKREEIKQQIQDAGYKGDNLDGIMDQCYEELFPDEEKYQGFEGLFYYEYLQVLQWLAIRLVQNNEDQDENNNEEMPLEKMIERLDFLIDSIEI